MMTFISIVLFLWLLILLAEPDKRWVPILGIIVFYVAQVVYYTFPMSMDAGLIQTSKFDLDLENGYYQLLDEDAQDLKDILSQTKRRHTSPLKSWHQDHVVLSLISPIYGYGGRFYILENAAYYQMDDKYYRLYMSSDDRESFFEIRDKYLETSNRSETIEGMTIETEVVGEKEGFKSYSLVIESPDNVVVDHVVVKRTNTNGSSSSTLQGDLLTKVFRDEFTINTLEPYRNLYLIIRGKKIVDGQVTLFQVREMLD